jgi:hypothetical protein
MLNKELLQTDFQEAANMGRSESNRMWRAAQAAHAEARGLLTMTEAAERMGIERRYAWRVPVWLARFPDAPELIVEGPRQRYVERAAFERWWAGVQARVERVRVAA